MQRKKINTKPPVKDKETSAKEEKFILGWTHEEA